MILDLSGKDRIGQDRPITPRNGHGAQKEEEFLNGFNDCFMIQIIDSLTFGANWMGDNILDLILTSDRERILEIGYWENNLNRLEMDELYNRFLSVYEKIIE